MAEINIPREQIQANRGGKKVELGRCHVAAEGSRDHVAVQEARGNKPRALW